MKKYILGIVAVLVLSASIVWGAGDYIKSWRWNPTTNTIDALMVDGTTQKVVATKSSTIRISDGTASVPAYSFISTGNSDNGMYLKTTDTLGWSIGSTERMYLDSTALTLSSGDLIVGSIYNPSNSTYGYSYIKLAGNTSDIVDITNRYVFRIQPSAGSGFIVYMTGVIGHGVTGGSGACAIKHFSLSFGYVRDSSGNGSLIPVAATISGEYGDDLPARGIGTVTFTAVAVSSTDIRLRVNADFTGTSVTNGSLQGVADISFLGQAPSSQPAWQ